MDKQKLLNYYLSLREREAYRWNLSPRSLYLELETRDFLTRHYKPSLGIKACNVGIGVGEWDDFLGYFLEGNGQLTSMDIDTEICELFELRQRMEGHSNPSKVICADFLSYLQPAEFDLLTLIGSTLNEIGDPEQTLAKACEILKNNGLLFIMNLEKYLQRDEINRMLRHAGFAVEVVEAYDRYPGIQFYCILARKEFLGR